MSPRFPVLLPLALCLLAGLVGCTKKREGKQQAVALAELARDHSTAINHATSAYVAALSPWLSGGKADLPALRTTLETLKPLPGKFRTAMEKAPFPEEESAVAGYHARVLDFIKVEESMIATLQVITEKVAATNPAPEALRREVQLQLEQAARAEQEAIRRAESQAKLMQSFLLQ